MGNNQPDGVALEGINCQITTERRRNGVVLMRISGWDAGELGNRPMQELAKYLTDEPIYLFIDARAVKGVSTDVSALWAQWLAKHRSHFEQINMLTGSPFIHLTANFVRRFADLSDLMRIYTEPRHFEAALGLAGE